MSAGCGISQAAIRRPDRPIPRRRRTRREQRCRPWVSRSRKSMSDLTLESVDRSGALAEAFDELTGGTRANFFSQALIGGGALLAALETPALAQPRNTAKDVAILRFDLNLEDLQGAMYS